MGNPRIKEEIWAGQALNIALQMMRLKNYNLVVEEDKFIEDLFKLGKKVFLQGKKQGFMNWVEG